MTVTTQNALSDHFSSSKRKRKLDTELVFEHVFNGLNCGPAAVWLEANVVLVG